MIKCPRTLESEDEVSEKNNDNKNTLVTCARVCTALSQFIEYGVKSVH